jgi:ParB family transcriptional regulator, chromosome partitioning protein
MIEQKNILLAEIRPDPNQPRKYYDEVAMQELTESVKAKGVLQPILIRPNGKGYILVCGERRYRAATAAGLKEIPVVIRELTDEEALELQIIENLQRKNVHPMEEAFAFKSLLEKGKEIKEIAARVGKNEYYVRQRNKLNALTKQWQTVFYRNQITVSTALTIAAFDEKTQAELWKECGREQGEIIINDWYLRRYRALLNSAPFDLNDVTLDKKAGACTSCAFNSATASLFPDAAADPKCTKPACYKHKSDIHFDRALKLAVEDPEVILVNPEYSSYEDNFIRKLKADGHPILNGRAHNNFSVIERPEKPDLADFDIDDYDNEKERMDSYQSELRDYEKELKAFESKIAGGKYKKGFAIHGSSKGMYLYLEMGKSSGSSSKASKAKESSGKLTAADIDDEIQRIREREKRSKEIDEEKVQRRVIDAVKNDKSLNKVPERCENIDRILIRFLLAEHIGFSNGDKIKKAIGISGGFNKPRGKEMWDKLVALTDQQVTYLVRQILLDKYAHDNPHFGGYMFRRMAESLGTIPIAAFETEQNETSQKRADRVAARIKQLQEKKKELTTKKKK